MSTSENIIAVIEQNGLKIVGLLLSVIGIIVYFDFLTFHKFFIAEDIASDQLRYYLPRYIFQADRFWSQNYSNWSFQFGLGQNVYDIVFNLNIFDRFLILFGRDGLLFAFPYITVLKHITAGILFFIYLRLLKISPYSAIIGSMLFAYSGYMVVQGQWYRHQDYAIFMIAFLIAFEMWFQKGKWIGLVLVLGFLCLKQILTIYHLPFVIGIYALFRYIQVYSFSWRPFLSLCLKLGVICLIGLGINAFELLPSIYHHLTSPRGSQGLNQFFSFSTLISFLELSSASDYLSVLYRFFSSDLIGTMNFYTGIINTLEGPNVYMGIIVLLLIPQTFFVFKKNNAKPFWILIIFLICYFAFPSMKMFLNAFVKYTYKSTVLYAVIFLLIIALSVLNQSMENSSLNKTNLLFTATVFCIFIITSYAIYSFLNIEIFDEKVLTIVLLLLFLYGFLLNLLPKYRFHPKIKVVLFIVVILEIVILSHTSVNTDRLHIDTDYIKNKQGYFDDSKAAIDSLRAADDGFFRVEKDYISDSHNDPLIQNYYGTTVYTPFGQSSHINFAREFHAKMIETKWIFGLKHQPGLMSIVGVKYYLTKSMDMESTPYGFRHIKTFNDIHIYENKYNLPLGFVYDTYIPYGEFRNLSKYQKERVVSKAFVSDDLPDGMAKLDVEGFKAQYSLKTVSLSAENIIASNVIRDTDGSGSLPAYRLFVKESRIVVDLAKKRLGDRVLLILVLDSRYEGYGRVSYGSRTSFNDSTKIRFRVRKGKSEYRIELNNDDQNIESFRLDFPDNRGEEIRIADIALETMNFMSGYAEDIQHLRQNPLKITSFEEDHIRGVVSVDTDNLLFLSIPHDDGWRIHVDGKETHPIVANVGFMGVPLKKGEHLIELKFTPHLMSISLMVSIISFCLTLLLHRRYPRIPAVAGCTDN